MSERKATMNHHTNRHREEDRMVRLIYCLSMDLIASTEAGLRMITRKLDSFNLSLVEQISPHIEKLELTDSLVKFTGDGWLLMTDDPDNVPALCCLATIMANRFQDEMSKRTGIAMDSIPSLRISICAGRDIRVKLPDGRTDSVGDSARRAVRASGYCQPNEILIDETVRYFVFRDFDVSPIDAEQRPLECQPKKTEEAFTLYVLGDLKPEVVAESEAPGYFVYTLDAIGKGDEAAVVAQQGEVRLIDAATRLGTSKQEVIPGILRSWNRLISSIRDYSTALEMLKNGMSVGFSPDVVTYNTLISKAPDYEAAKSWVDKMEQENIQPDSITYNTLISKADNYDTAKSWIMIMRQNGIIPDVTTYDTIIAKSPDYESGKAWIETMWLEDLQPDATTYNTLIEKASDYQMAKLGLEMMQQEGITPNVNTYNILILKTNDYEVAKKCVDKMRQGSIQPNVATYNVIISLASDYDTAMVWIKTMSQEQIQPDVSTYNALFSKNISDKSAEAILNWYLSQPYHPEGPLQLVITAYCKDNLIDEALRLAIDYPHLEASRKVIRENGDKALQYFTSVSQQDPTNPNVNYALGITLMELGREIEAQKYLKKALRLNKHGHRKTLIEEGLRQLSNYLGMDR